MCQVGLPQWLCGKESVCNARDTEDLDLIPGSGKSLGGGNDKPLQYSCHENPMNSMKMQKGMTVEDEPSRLESIQYATGEELKGITNSSRKNEVTGPKRK